MSICDEELLQDKKDEIQDRERILILGAAGRDFHDFNISFRSKPEYDVVGFTVAQIPEIAR
jgi:predicted GTPase